MVNLPGTRAVVVGGGFGGLAAALRLRAKGYHVTIVDKQDQLGGRAYQYRRDTPLGTFVHDAGPTVITARFLIDELFELFGRQTADYVRLVDLYPWYRIRFADGSHFDYGGTLEQMKAQIGAISPTDLEGFDAFLAHSRRIFDIGFTKLGSAPFHDFSTMLACSGDLIRLESYKTVWGLARKYFTNEKLRRVFSFQPLLVGGNPFNTTSIYSLIFYLEREWGVQFAMGGTGALVRGLQRLMEEQSIEILLSTEVTQITGTSSGGQDRVAGVWLKPADGQARHLLADLVVCNADAPHAYLHLLDAKYRKGLATHRVGFQRWPMALKYSMGLFVLYFGTNRTYPEVAHHTIILGRRYRELISRIFDSLELDTEDLSVYLHRPTCTDPSMAPPGCESFYVLVPVPNLLSGLDYQRLGPLIRDATVRYLEKTELPGLSSCIVDDFFVTPQHFAERLNTLHGTGFSIQPIFSQSAWFRFHNRAGGLQNLYFVGAATHPGAGMPGVLCSAKLVDQLIQPLPDFDSTPAEGSLSK